MSLCVTRFSSGKMCFLTLGPGFLMMRNFLTCWDGGIAITQSSRGGVTKGEGPGAAVTAPASHSAPAVTN